MHGPGSTKSAALSAEECEELYREYNMTQTSLPKPTMTEESTDIPT